MLVLRVVAQPGYWDQAHAKLPVSGSWGTGTLAVAVTSMSKVQECEDLSWKRDLGH